MKNRTLNLTVAGFFFLIGLYSLVNFWQWLSSGDANHTSSGNFRLHDLYFILLGAAQPGDLLYWDSVHFVYPPLVAALAHSLAVLPYERVWPAWLVFSGACWSAALLICSRNFPGPPRIILWAAWLAFWPFYWCLAAGQNSALSLLLLISAIHFYRRKQGLLAGFCFLLLFYKPQFLGCLFLTFLVARQWRSALGVIIAGLAGVGVGILNCGWGQYFWWFKTLFQGSVTGFNLPINYTFLAFFKSLQGLFLFPSWLVPLLSGISLAGVLVFWGWRFYIQPFSWKNPGRFFFALAGVLMASPYFAVYDMTILAACFILSIFWSLSEESWSLFLATALMFLSTIFSFLSWKTGISFGVIPWLLWMTVAVMKLEFPKGTRSNRWGAGAVEPPTLATL